MAETGSVHATRFEAAVKVIQSLPKNGSFQPTNEMMLKFYSFYKQATQGPCNIPRPGFWDPIGRYKWDAWSALGDMSKEEAMIAYVEEMKKILESMPMTDKVEELLQVIGPFYEIVEDKKNRGSGLTSDLSNVMNSTPNIKAVNGKAESSDSGAESEEEGLREEEEKELQQNVKDCKSLKTESLAAKDLENSVANDCYKDSFIPDMQNGIQTKSALNGLNVEEEIKKTEPSLEIANNCDHQGANEENTEEVSGMQHLTSDSDSEVYCDSMEQLGLEEPLEITQCHIPVPPLCHGTSQCHIPVPHPSAMSHPDATSVPRHVPKATSVPRHVPKATSVPWHIPVPPPRRVPMSHPNAISSPCPSATSAPGPHVTSQCQLCAVSSCHIPVPPPHRVPVPPPRRVPMSHPSAISMPCPHVTSQCHLHIVSQCHLRAVSPCHIPVPFPRRVPMSHPSAISTPCPHGTSQCHLCTVSPCHIPVPSPRRVPMSHPGAISTPCPHVTSRCHLRAVSPCHIPVPPPRRVPASHHIPVPPPRCHLSGPRPRVVSPPSLGVPVPQ